VEVDVVTVRVEVRVWLGARVSVVGLRVRGRPAGDTVVVRLTLPEKPFKLVMLIDAVAENPALPVMLLGLTLMAKSGVMLVEKVAG
jgi:hypothetical protein